MKKVLVSFILLLVATIAQAQSNKQSFDFEFEGVRLNGVLDIPTDSPPKGMILLVHGSGKTNAVAQDWHSDVKATMVKAGYATYIWDKMGCGKSGGTFNYHQSVHNSAAEVIAAIEGLQQAGIVGSDKIGLWGISRAGWINPIVINEYQDIKFWISTSGVDDKENFNYLFAENLKIAGLPTDTIALLINELRAGVQITHAGGDYETYLGATKNLRKNAFLNRFNNGAIVTEAGYYSYQNTFREEALDPETGLQIYVQNFASMLSKIDCPVLALFGEQDKHVDWEKTKTLYENTISPKKNLTIKSFPNCNHNLFQCETGGFYEFKDNKLPKKRCEGYLEAIGKWLKELE